MDKEPTNGEKKVEEKESTEPKVILQVIMNPDGSCAMKTSMQPPMVVYLFEELKFNLLSQKNEKPTLFKPSGFTSGLKKMFKR